MGIVNVTPDSFSDGGAFLEPEAALARCRALVLEGADIVDLGAESTRPGASPVSTEQELARLAPLLERLPEAALTARISIDTSKAAVARAAIEAGAQIVNDVTALRGDPQMGALIADSGVECCLMHMQGDPQTMQRDPHYEDVVGEVKAFLEERLRYATSVGIAEERIVLDPGIGFGKSTAHNLELLRRLEELLQLGRPLLVGTSRKGFLGSLAAYARGLRDALPSEERLPGTIASCVLAFERGATIFRVHDVAAVGDALAVATATLRG
jgi:dihydropteroate synthase